MKTINLKAMKEFFLMMIEGTADWRSAKAEEYPNDGERNLTASTALRHLHKYVSDLPENDPVFEWYESLTEETEIQRLNDEIRMFGYQNRGESPQKFIERLTNPFCGYQYRLMRAQAIIDENEIFIKGTISKSINNGKA